MKRIALTIITLCLCGGMISAQRLINVKGRVMQKVAKLVDGKKVSAVEPYEYIHVYGLPDKAAADYAEMQFRDLTDRNLVWELCIGPMYNRPQKEAMTAIDGTYTVRDVPENGYLIFLPYQGAAKVLPINGMLEMEDVLYDNESGGDDAIVLGAVDVTAEDLGPSVDGERIGDIYAIRSDIPIIELQIKKNVRVLVQPYFVDCFPETLPEEQRKDTFFLTPIVYYASENELTSERRQGFMNTLDSLLQFSDTLDIDKTGKMPIHRKFRYPDAHRNYKAFAEIFYEEYNGVFDKETIVIKHCEDKNPMKFLDFDFGAVFLNPADPAFKVQPIESFQDAVGDINLAFLNGKAELDPNNPNNDIEIAKLQDEMLAIENSGNNVLRTLTITGKASPEGNYESNRSLAGRRINFALGKITSVFDQYTRNRLKITQTPIVAGWEEVADSMAADSLFAEAEEIRAICSRYEGNMGQQYNSIRALSYYNSVIKEVYLPKLRSVKYQYTYQTMRSLTDAEILAKYKASRDSVGKNVFFDRYEYWRLTNIVKDSVCLKDIYKRYYEYTKKNQRKPDELAACNHAAFCIREGIADTTMLAPFIKKSRRANFEMMNMYEEKEMYNREAVVANQLAMYVLAYDYRNAGIMSSILPDNENNRLLRAFVKCLSGHYRKPQYYEPVAASSPNNKVVIYIAIDNLSLAKVVAEEELDDKDPRKFYFLAQIHKKMAGETKDIVDNLLKCFQLDESFVPIADADAVFVNNKGEKKEYVQAFDKFIEWKNKKKSDTSEE